MMQVVEFSDSALARARALTLQCKGKVDPSTEHFFYGHAAQFTHDEAFVAARVDIELPTTPQSPYDRIVNGMLQDDKLAMLHDGQHTKDHYASLTEIGCWNNRVRAGEDVIIHSFEFIDERTFRYRAPISYRLSQLEWRDFNGSFSLRRESAYRYNIPRFSK